MLSYALANIIANIIAFLIVILTVLSPTIMKISAATGVAFVAYYLNTAVYNMYHKGVTPKRN